MFGAVRYSFAIVAFFCVAVLAGERAFGQVLKADAAYGTWQDERPGLRRLLTPKDLPPIEKPSCGLAQGVPIPTAARPQVPDGASVELVTSAPSKRRVVREAPNGDLFVADTMFGTVHVLRVPSGGTQPVRDEVFARGLKQPFGIAFYPLAPSPRWVYIATSDGVVRFRYKNGDLKAMGKAEQIIAGIPTTHHYVRETAPMGAAWDTEELRADVLSFDPDGTHMQIVATGLRNCEGMTVQPATGELWCIVNERDELGDNTPFECATHVIPGAFFGWPRYFIGGHENPRHVMVPDVLMQAHWVPLQIAFYEGDNFPTSGADARSRDLYIANCSACHQASGEGLPGVFPPLKGSSVVNKDDAVKHIQVVLNGMQGARAGGVVYAAIMPPFAATLSDTEIADIIDYERSSWGNHGTPVTAARVAAERALSE